MEQAELLEATSKDKKHRAKIICFPSPNGFSYYLIISDRNYSLRYLVARDIKTSRRQSSVKRIKPEFNGNKVRLWIESLDTFRISFAIKDNRTLDDLISGGVQKTESGEYYLASRKYDDPTQRVHLFNEYELGLIDRNSIEGPTIQGSTIEVKVSYTKIKEISLAAQLI